MGDPQEDLRLADLRRARRRRAVVRGGAATAWEYSNLGYALLGRVISAATGRDYREYVAHRAARAPRHDLDRVRRRRRAGRAAGQGDAPVDAGLVPEPFTGSGAFSPMGGLLSTARHRHVGRRLPALVGLPGVDDHPLDRWSRREMQEPQRYVTTMLTTSEGSDPVVVSTSYGFGLVVDDDLRLGRTVSHSGGYPGFGSHMRWHPATGWGVVVLANRTHARRSASAPR